MRAEDPPEHVQLVDDDVSQPPQELRPPVVVGEHPAVQHLGVGQHRRGVAADPRPFLVARVAVVGARHDAGELACRPAPAAGRGPGPWSGTPATPCPAAPAPPPPRRAAPGSRATCPRPSRWPRRPTAPPAPGRWPAPGATTACRRPAGPRPRREAGAPAHRSRASRGPRRWTWTSGPRGSTPAPVPPRAGGAGPAGQQVGERVERVACVRRVAPGERVDQIERVEGDEGHGRAQVTPVEFHLCSADQDRAGRAYVPRRP